MPTKSNWIDQGLLLCMEWVLFFTVSQLVSKWGGSIWHMVWTLFVLGVLFATGMFLLKYKYNRNRMGVYYVLSLIMVVVSWLIFSWPIILSFGLVLFFLWRLFSFIEGQTVRIRWWLWIVTVCLILALWVMDKSNVMHREFIGLLMIQTLLIAGYEGVTEWRISKRLVGAATAFVSFIAVAICGWVIHLLFPYIKWVIYLILDGILYGLSFVFDGIWNLVTHFLHPGSPSHKNALNNMMNNFNRPKPKGTERIPIGHGSHPELLLIPIVIILLIISFFIIRSFRFSTKASQGNHPPERRSMLTTSQPKTHGPRFFDRLNAPKDPVRAAIFQLQKKTRKTELGRHKYETLSEWLDRLAIQHPLHNSIQSVYDRVRYGKAEELSDDQTRSFEEAMGNVEADLKKDK